MVGRWSSGAGHGTMVDMPTLHLSQDPDADDLLGRDPLALLIGMLLDQQIPTTKG